MHFYNLHCFFVFAEILWYPSSPSSREKDTAIGGKHSTERQVDGAWVHKCAGIPAESVNLKLYSSELAATKGPRSEWLWPKPLLKLFMNKSLCEVSSYLLFLTILKETYKMLYNPVFCCDFNSASIQEKENIKTGIIEKEIWNFILRFFSVLRSDGLLLYRWN